MNSGSELTRERIASVGDITGRRAKLVGNVCRDEVPGLIAPTDNIAALRAQHLRLPRHEQSSTRELGTANRRYGELLATVSHELRSPLAAIRHAICLLGKQNIEAVVRQQARTRAERQICRMARLVDDLLAVSQIGSHRFGLQRERIDLRGVVQQAIETVESNLSEHHHRLTVDLPDAPVWLYADSGRLEQVFVNLLINAGKYTGAGGELGLSIQQEDGQAVVRVRDSGIGIAPEKLPYVFDLFMQVDRSARHSEAGLGIGLALVRGFVEAHGGRVNAASAGLGRGSEFIVCLPTSGAQQRKSRCSLPRASETAGHRYS